ncbi:hypothetical protein ACFLZN_02470 [Nanoarchaeota archaeon]
MMEEVRLTLDDLEKTREVILKLGAVGAGNYKFVDKILVIDEKKIDTELITVRIMIENNRGTSDISSIIITNESKISKDFKSQEEAIEYVKNIGYRQILTITRDGTEYVLNKTRLFLENIYGLGPSLEIEGSYEDIVELQRKIPFKQILKISVPEACYVLQKSMEDVLFPTPFDS